jgi:hypothetical protein
MTDSHADWHAMLAFCAKHSIEHPNMAQSPDECGRSLIAIAIAMVKELDEAKASLIENNDGLSSRAER